MRRIRHFLHQLVTREDGPTSVEYAVVIALILLVCIGAVNSVGNSLSESVQSSSDQIGKYTGSGSSDSSGGDGAGSGKGSDAGSGSGRGNSGGAGNSAGAGNSLGRGS